ncbi:MAG: hypothetical protein AB8G14_04755, partial [Ilumatobacter sp.]
IWPGGERPNASSLNPAPGQRVVNAVTVQLAADQTFQLFNNRGNVNVFVDVNGYYENHNHDDRYALRSEVQDLLQGPPIRSTVRYQSAESEVAATVSTMTKMRNLGVFTSSGGVVRVEWSSNVWALGTPSRFCNIGIRIDGEASTPVGAFGLNGTEATVYGADTSSAVNTLDIFTELPAGNHQLELYYRTNDAACVENFGGFTRTIHITETTS